MKEITVNTALGRIAAVESKADFPGIWITIDGKEVALVEHDLIDDAFKARVWDDNHPDDEPDTTILKHN